MKGTKQRILDKSLQLFNKKGVSVISLRDISRALNISIGNLHYHYKKREDIIESLYFQMVNEIDKEIEILSDDFSFHKLFDIPNSIIRVLFSYRFFLIDFVSISRSNNKIKSHYSVLTLKREEQFLFFVNILIDMNILRKPLLRKQYADLYRLIEVYSNFWFSNCLINKENLSEDVLQEYSELFKKMLFPYLTEQGQITFYEIYNDFLL